MEKVYHTSNIQIYSGSAIKGLVMYTTTREELTEIKHWKKGEAENKIAWWGSKNQLPQEREAILQDNNIVPELIMTKRGIILGQGLAAFRDRYENGSRIREQVEMPAVISDFLETINRERTGAEAAGELLKHGNIFVEFTRLRNKKINQISIHPC